MNETGSGSGAAIWIDAMRPRTLPLAIASILMGSALAASRSPFSWTITILAITTAVLLQILSNLANDYGDSQHGADSVQREGPLRAVQSGAVSSRAMLLASGITALLAMISGLALLWVAFGSEGRQFFVLFVLLGLAAILAAVGYTAGFRPYGYAGLGDLAVLIFFGWAAVMGTYFLQTMRLDWDIFLPATSCGLLAVAVLNINNIRDRRSDSLAGKNHGSRALWSACGPSLSLVSNRRRHSIGRTLCHPQLHITLAVPLRGHDPFLAAQRHPRLAHRRPAAVEPSVEADVNFHAAVCPLL